jgi:hypothetical protein
MILHDWNLEKKKQLIKSAYAALPKGGAFIAVENLIDDARRENAFGLATHSILAESISGNDVRKPGSITTKSFIWWVRAARRSRTNDRE